MTNFQEKIQEESKKYGASQTSSLFEFQKGVNKIRILTHPEVLATHFFGKGNPAVVCVGIEEGCPHHKPESDRPSLKLITYVIDRNDGNVKLAELPLSISYSLNDLQQDEDYTFEDFPMPYDVKITYDPDNPDPKAKYRLVGSPKREELSKEEQETLDEKMKEMTPANYVEKRKEKQKTKEAPENKEAPEYPQEDINTDEVPF